MDIGLKFRPEDFERISRLAREGGVSKSEIARQAIESFEREGRDELYRRLATFRSRFSSFRDEFDELVGLFVDKFDVAQKKLGATIDDYRHATEPVPEPPEPPAPTFRTAFEVADCASCHKRTRKDRLDKDGKCPVCNGTVAPKPGQAQAIGRCRKCRLVGFGKASLKDGLCQKCHEERPATVGGVVT